MIWAATGHRPHKLNIVTSARKAELLLFAMKALELYQPEKIIIGMGPGWDQTVGLAAYMLNIPFIAAVPYPKHPKQGSEDEQRHYQTLLDQAEQVHLVSEWNNPNLAFSQRNEWMVDHAGKVLALYDGSIGGAGRMGGTRNCLIYARKKGVPVVNLWDTWSLLAADRDLVW